MEKKDATVIFDPAHLSPRSLAEAIEDMGFESSVENAPPTRSVATETQFFPADTWNADSLPQLRRLEGVLEVRDDGDRLSVMFVPGLTGSERIRELLATPDRRSHSVPPVTKRSADSSSVEMLKLRVDGMTCLSCTTTIEGKIGKLKGVERIKGESGTEAWTHEDVTTHDALRYIIPAVITSAYSANFYSFIYLQNLIKCNFIYLNNNNNK